MQQFPGGFTQNVTGVHGEAGTEWLRRLDEIIAECERRWSFTVRPPFVPLSYNYVAPAVRADGTEAVLKLGVPHHQLMSEMEALRLYDGSGMVRLLEADFDLGAMLLERLEPGALLSRLEDDQKATSIAAEVMRQLRRPPPPDHQFPTVSDWGSGLQKLRHRFDGTTGPLQAYLVDKAESLFSELIGTMGALVLLHGNLHHDNILSAVGKSWLAIDPKGVVGGSGIRGGRFCPQPPAPQAETGKAVGAARRPICRRVGVRAGAGIGLVAGPGGAIGMVEF